MRTIQCVIISMILGVVCAFSQSSQSVSVHYPGYTLTVALSSGADAGLAPFLVGKLDQVPEKNTGSRFGILYRENAVQPEAFTVLEVVDAGTNRVIKKVSLSEYYGKESASWKNVASENKSSETGVTSVFQCQTKEGGFKFIREISTVADPNAPLGKKIVLTFSIEPKSALKLKVKFYGSAEGTVTSSSQCFVVTNAEPLTALRPAFVAFVKEAAQIQVEALKKGKPQTFVVTSKEAAIGAGQKQEVLSFVTAGTTILFPGQVEKQAKNLEKYFTTNKPVPDMAVVTQPNKLKAVPGDTLTYTVYYHNIGTDVVSDISLVGPIPQNASYLERSAESNGTIMTLTRAEAKAPAVGEVTSVNWNDKQTIKAGEERWVRYKVIIR